MPGRRIDWTQVAKYMEHRERRLSEPSHHRAFHETWASMYAAARSVRGGEGRLEKRCQFNRFDIAIRRLSLQRTRRPRL